MQAFICNTYLTIRTSHVICYIMHLHTSHCTSCAPMHHHPNRQLWLTPSPLHMHHLILQPSHSIKDIMLYHLPHHMYIHSTVIPLRLLLHRIWLRKRPTHWLRLQLERQSPTPSRRSRPNFQCLGNLLPNGQLIRRLSPAYTDLTLPTQLRRPAQPALLFLTYVTKAPAPSVEKPSSPCFTRPPTTPTPTIHINILFSARHAENP